MTISILSNRKGFRRLSNTSSSSMDRMAQHKKVKDWFLHPAKYGKEIDAEKCKYPDKCIYYLSASHATDDCNIKKECDQLIIDQKSKTPSASTLGSNGQLRHNKEDVLEDAVTEDVVDVVLDSYDTNQDVLYYFARMTNHYLHL